MGLLAGVNYDPAVAVSQSTASLLAQTAFDATNLRLTFTAPNGPRDGSGLVAVIARQHGLVIGATTNPQVLTAVLDGATVRGRSAVMMPRVGGSITQHNNFESAVLIPGLTPGQSYTFDAAYGVETVVASTNIKYGGPNDSTTNNAFGGYGFEIHDTPGFLAGVHYDPAVAATASIGTAIAMTGFDATNLRLTFNGPPAGNVIVRVRAPVHGTAAATGGVIMFGVLDGATVRARQSPLTWMNTQASPAVTDIAYRTSRCLVTGLTPGQSYTWDAAYEVETIGASGSIAYGGPNDTTADNAFGGFGFDIWDAASVSGTGAFV